MQELGGQLGSWAVLWRATLSISERERLTGIDYSKLVLSRRGMRRLSVAGGSQLGEEQQQCLCLLVLFLAAVPERAFRCSASHLVHRRLTTRPRVQYSVPGGHGTPGVDLLH